MVDYDWFNFLIKQPLYSVTSTQFNETYTFTVGFDGTIPYPTFTTVPSPTYNSL